MTNFPLLFCDATEISNIVASGRSDMAAVVDNKSMLWRPKNYLDLFQTSNFTCTELNANKLQQKTILIYIEFGTCKVRRLNWALVIFTFKVVEGNILPAF